MTKTRRNLLSEEGALPARVRQRHSRTAGLAILVLLVWTTVPIAAVLVVDTTADLPDAVPGDGVCAVAPPAEGCSLRAAVQEANALAGSDLVELPPGEFGLALAGSDEEGALTGDLDLLDDLALTGAGEGVTVIDGLVLDRVLDLGPAGEAVAVELRDLTLRGGLVDGVGDERDGGCVRIAAAAELALERVTVTGCACRAAGCGLAVAGRATGNHVSLTDNAGIDAPQGFSTGGAIAVLGASATVLLDHCLLADNVATNGGAIITSGGFQTPPGERARLELDACSLVGNEALQLGGAILANAATDVVIRDSTLSGNVAGGGGALANDGGCTFDIRNSTITANHAVGIGGGIGEVHFDASFIGLANTVLAGNTADFFGPDCNLTFHSDGGTLVGDTDSCTVVTGPGDLLGVAPMLSAVTAVGPRTRVHVPLPGSPLIDGGQQALCTLHDQLGTSRPQDGDGDGTAECDIGAVELPLLLFADGFESGSTGAWSTATP